MIVSLTAIKSYQFLIQSTLTLLASVKLQYGVNKTATELKLVDAIFVYFAFFCLELQRLVVN